jgi:uncharacterized protein YndB with AHSA1/START domain
MKEFAMNDNRRLIVTTPSEGEIAMRRVFDAPRGLVFDAWTMPEMLKHWLGVRGGWTVAVCEVDLKVGGSYRFVWQGPEGLLIGMRGIYREIVRPERLVATESFDEPWYPGEALAATVLTEADHRTTATTTVRYESREARDTVLATPMTRGVAESYDKLGEYLLTAT